MIGGEDEFSICVRTSDARSERIEKSCEWESNSEGDTTWHTCNEQRQRGSKHGDDDMRLMKEPQLFGEGQFRQFRDDDTDALLAR